MTTITAKLVKRLQWETGEEVMYVDLNRDRLENLYNDK